MGGNSLSAGAAGRRRLGREPRRDPRQRRRPAAHQLRRQHPLQRDRPVRWPNFGYEVNNRWQFSDDLTWVKGRHTLKAGFEYRHHQFPSRGWAVGAVGGQFDFNRLKTGGYDASGNNLGQTGDPFASFLLGQVLRVEPDDPRPAHVQRGLHRDVGQRRVQGQRQADADARVAPRLPDRAHGEQRRVLDVRSEHAEPRRGRHPRRAHLRRRRHGPLGSPDLRESERWTRGDRGSGFAYRMNDKNVIRGGYGMYYSGVAFSQFIGAADARIPGATRFAPNLTQRQGPRVLSRQRLPARSHRAAAVHRSDVRQRRQRRRRAHRTG